MFILPSNTKQLQVVKILYIMKASFVLNVISSLVIISTGHEMCSQLSTLFFNEWSILTSSSSILMKVCHTDDCYTFYVLYFAIVICQCFIQFEVSFT